MKRSRGILTTLNTGIFPASVMFAMNMSHDEVMSELKRQKCDEWLAGIEDDKKLMDGGNWCALRRDIEKGDERRTLFYIFIREFDFSDYNYCKLAHEVLHICQFMMRDFLDPDREYEAVAYTHTHLMKQCLEAIRTVKKHKK